MCEKGVEMQTGNNMDMDMDGDSNPEYQTPNPETPKRQKWNQAKQQQYRQHAQWNALTTFILFILNIYRLFFTIILKLFFIAC